MVFILKKVFSPFILPPGLVVVFLLFSGAWLLSKKNLKAGFINISIGILLWILSISTISDALLRGLESRFKIPPEPEGDVIILLGGGADDKAPDLSGTGVPGGYTTIRMLTAVRVQKRLDVPILVSGGRVYRHLSGEAMIIKRFLRDLGVPEDKIIVEDRSRDSIESARFSKILCDERGFKRPLLVTSAYHMKRVIFSFRKAGLDVMPLPAGFGTWDEKTYHWVDYLPSADALEKTAAAIHEYIGLFFYSIAY